jgi:hypothetical protein
MYFMYIDESGDPGRYNGSNTPHFILSGLIVPVQDWRLALERITAFREEVKQRTGLAKREEIHSAELIRPGRQMAYKQITNTARIQILRDFVGGMPGFFPNARILNVCLDKQQFPHYDEYLIPAWQRLLAGFEAFLGSQQAFGAVMSDATDANRLRGLLRTMRRGPNPPEFLLEDVFHCASEHSYFVQAADAITYCLFRQEYPKGSTRKFNLGNLFQSLDGLLLKSAAPADAQGVIRA